MTRTRKLVAIMFTDIEGYTALMQHDEGKAVRVRQKHRRIFESMTEKHNGLSLLDRLLLAAEEGGRNGSAIEILILQALAIRAKNDIVSALEPLERALRLAETEGYVRIFVDEGPFIEQLLKEALTKGIMPTYIGTLLAEFKKTVNR